MKRLEIAGTKRYIAEERDGRETTGDCIGAIGEILRGINIRRGKENIKESK